MIDRQRTSVLSMHNT